MFIIYLTFSSKTRIVFDEDPYENNKTRFPTTAFEKPICVPTMMAHTEHSVCTTGLFFYSITMIRPTIAYGAKTLTPSQTRTHVPMCSKAIIFLTRKSTSLTQFLNITQYHTQLATTLIYGNEAMFYRIRRSDYLLAKLVYRNRTNTPMRCGTFRTRLPRTSDCGHTTICTRKCIPNTLRTRAHISAVRSEAVAGTPVGDLKAIRIQFYSFIRRQL